MTTHFRKAVRNIIPSTLLNTLNRSKRVIYTPHLCRATAKIRLTSSDMSPSTMESVRCALSNRKTCHYGV
jgi:hypothetical protein